MCEYKMLHSNENGYVVKCHQCRHLQIAFGNIAVCQTEEEFYSFKSSISNFCQENNIHLGCPNFKQITIATPASQVKLRMNATEMMQLDDLLQQAGFALQIEKLLDFKN